MPFLAAERTPMAEQARRFEAAVDQPVQGEKGLLLGAVADEEGAGLVSVGVPLAAGQEIFDEGPGAGVGDADEVRPLVRVFAVVADPDAIGEPVLVTDAQVGGFLGPQGPVLAARRVNQPHALLDPMPVSLVAVEDERRVARVDQGVADPLLLAGQLAPAGAVGAAEQDGAPRPLVETFVHVGIDDVGLGRQGDDLGNAEGHRSAVGGHGERGGQGMALGHPGDDALGQGLQMDGLDLGAVAVERLAGAGGDHGAGAADALRLGELDHLESREVHPEQVPRPAAARGDDQGVELRHDGLAGEVEPGVVGRMGGELDHLEARLLGGEDLVFGRYLLALAEGAAQQAGGQRHHGATDARPSLR